MEFLGGTDGTQRRVVKRSYLDGFPAENYVIVRSGKLAEDLGNAVV